MPLTSISTFNPDTLTMLQTVQDDVCRLLTRPDAIRLDAEVRNALALRIMNCAKTGERDPVRLKASALAGLRSGTAYHSEPNREHFELRSAILKRAYRLARSATCKNISEIGLRLKMEGYLS